MQMIAGTARVARLHALAPKLKPEVKLRVCREELGISWFWEAYWSGGSTAFLAITALRTSNPVLREF